MEDQECVPADLLGMMVVTQNPRQLPLVGYMLVGGAYHIIHGHKGHDLPKHHHVQLLS